MPAAIADQVVDFFDDLFARIFSDAFRPRIEDVLQLDALGSSRQAAADERFEPSYRDYLLQRFHRVEAGRVRNSPLSLYFTSYMRHI